MEDYKYLLIFEDGELKKTNTITDEDLQSSDDGYIDIVNMDSMSRYLYGEWVEIEAIERR